MRKIGAMEEVTTGAAANTAPWDVAKASNLGGGGAAVVPVSSALTTAGTTGIVVGIVIVVVVVVGRWPKSVLRRCGCGCG